jgi:hypothetical protein
MDVSFAVFYVVYAFVFNWAYDRIFPLPEWQAADRGGLTPSPRGFHRTIRAADGADDTLHVWRS